METKWNSRKRLHALAAFLPDLEAANFSAGEHIVPKDTENSVFRIPFIRSSDTVSRFFEMLHESGWVEPFDWPKWAQTEEAKRLFTDDNAIASASADHLSKILTTCVRRDRFCWGDPLIQDFESGLMTRIVQRADVLLRERE